MLQSSKASMINILFPGKVEVFQSRFILSFLAESITLYSVLNTKIESKKKKEKKKQNINYILFLLTYLVSFQSSLMRTSFPKKNKSDEGKKKN